MATLAVRHEEDRRPEMPRLRRRVSMEEDYFYQELMATSLTRRMSLPPPYVPCPEARMSLDKDNDEVMVLSAEDDTLPRYSCDIIMEGVFSMKMEIESTIKRAEDRHWHTMFVQLQGTALHIYRVKKDWGLSRTGKSGPHISPDNPPWVKKAVLEKTYTLLHADVGIAADYQKRRYVLRARAETDQFLLSCIELPNFVRWLDALFAAINVAPAIDDRDFPRDQSIPRSARLRYFRGETDDLGASDTNGPPRPAPVIHHSAMTPRVPPPSNTGPEPGSEAEAESKSESESHAGAPDMNVSAPYPFPLPPLEPISTRLSTTSYPNEGLVPETGKWRPRHQWTTAHDMVYAKLCYAVLLFRSPRKSNYIIMKGKKWFVDWSTGRMIRVLPPGYTEHEVTGPFQMWNAENRRI